MGRSIVGEICRLSRERRDEQCMYWRGSWRQGVVGRRWSVSNQNYRIVMEFVHVTCNR